MRDADRAGSISRRDFLRRATVTAAAASASLIVGEAMWEAFEAFGPRRLLVAGITPEATLIASFDASAISAAIRVTYEHATFPIFPMTPLREQMLQGGSGRRWRATTGYAQ